ncbi:MAG: CDGSH iron-sulfur domain-containing protein [bacterium]
MEKKCDNLKKPRITVAKHSPYVASDIPKMVNGDGKELPVKSTFVLCRCGKSKEMPYCDGAHTETGLNMVKAPDRIPDRNKNYYGEEITVHFNYGVCSHDGACLKLKPVFKVNRRPWILPDLGSREAIIETIKKCPSGALSYTVDGTTHKDFFKREPLIRVAPGGPLMIEGGIELKDDQDSCPETKEHYCLCRCGDSKNHPFCDGTHLNNGFYESKK